MGKHSRSDRVLRINALWDDGAGVWSASGDDVIGLAIEAKTQEELLNLLKVVVPELLALNHPESAGIASSEPRQQPAELCYHGSQTLGLSC